MSIDEDQGFQYYEEGQARFPEPSLMVWGEMFYAMLAWGLAKLGVREELLEKIAEEEPPSQL